MSPPQSKTWPLIFLGLDQTKDPGLLKEGEWINAQNISSIQEGSISARLGSRKYPNTSGMTQVLSMFKLSLNTPDAQDQRYVGDTQRVWRITGPFSSYQDVTSTLVTAGQISLPMQPFEAAPFDASGTGRPTMYFAYPQKMLRDDGTFSSLRYWGIPRPATPAVSSLGSPNLV